MFPLSRLWRCILSEALKKSAFCISGAKAPESLQQVRRQPEGRRYPNIDLFRVSLVNKGKLALGNLLKNCDALILAERHSEEQL